jgi:lipopolysaccharide transport system ATP-binding protein
MEPAIKVERLSKRYRLGTKNGAYRTLRESISAAAIAPWRGVTRLTGRPRTGGDAANGNGSADDFWALRDVSFEVKPGEVVGIIGRNGAGKSTLLKILSRITEPTSGRAEFRGRIGSLLEVGTGFHPELTGRENIYLNGSILGMSRREIARRFDEIVAFSEVEEFIDTPVKRYSSGMYVRLAFAVAAHLDPEILLVDEVLAVGDATYQKRCIDRMSQIARSGRSILFVSHNMDLIPRLCQKAVRLERGCVVSSGPADAVVRGYLEDWNDCSDDTDLSGSMRSGDGRASFTHVWLIGRDGQMCRHHRCGEDLGIRVRILSHQRISSAAFAVNVMTLGGGRIHSAWTRESGFPVSLDLGIQEYQCDFRNVRLRPGQRMRIGLWLEAGNVVDFVDDAATFQVVDGPGAERSSTDSQQGIVLCDYEWSRIPQVQERQDI